MDLFLAIALSANVLLTAVCAYCLGLAVYKTSPEENAFLERVVRWTRKLIVIGGALFTVFLVYTALMLVMLLF